jgi:predicted enzyme related to lactoylglutathione lyase
MPMLPLRRLVTFGATLLLTASCATLPSLPPLPDSGQALIGKVVWHDLVTPDLAAAQRFYGGVLGWTFEAVNDDYVLARNGGRYVGGLANLDSPSGIGYWVPLVSVADVDAAAALATSSGGKVHLKPFDLPGRGRVAVLGDPRGAAFGVVRSGGGDPPDARPGVGDWLWNEVWTDDAAAAVAFYQKLAGYRPARVQVGNVNYQYLEQAGKARVGVLQKPAPELPSAWIGYVRVADPAAAARRARELGGTVLLDARPDPRGGTIAIIRDPSGAGLILQQLTDS